MDNNDNNKNENKNDNGDSKENFSQHAQRESQLDIQSELNNINQNCDSEATISDNEMVNKAIVEKNNIKNTNKQKNNEKEKINDKDQGKEDKSEKNKSSNSNMNENGTDNTKVVDFANDTNNTIDDTSDIESICTISEMEFDDDSENGNILDKLDFKGFKEMVLSNNDRAIMHDLALESFMDKDFSYINTFDGMVQFSRKNIIYDNSCDNHHVKDVDKQFFMKDQVLSLAKNANIDSEEYVKLRFLSSKFKKYPNFKFMVIFRSWIQLMAEKKKDGIFAKIKISDMADFNYFENEIEHTKKMNEENFKKLQRNYKHKLVKYEKDLKDYNEKLNLWQQQQHSYAYRVGNNNNNVKKPRKPYKPEPPTK